jgi:hypothetical protein
MGGLDGLRIEKHLKQFATLMLVASRDGEKPPKQGREAREAPRNANGSRVGAVHLQVVDVSGDSLAPPPPRKSEATQAQSQQCH